MSRSTSPHPSHLDLPTHFSVADIRKEVQDTWDNVKLSGYLLRDHELVVNNVHITAESKKKRKRIINYEALKIPHAAVQELQESLNCVSKNLQCWPYSAEAALFMRAPKNTDFNVLDSVVRINSWSYLGTILTSV